ncbi:BLUF domain-containing protein [Herbiconiux sp. YIM B11900]|uniref:BLUF domain-containing protein n=1 Tax=Herbiconiux sp. YIM B11900 TaxID=3404131 RepID=UPI003F852216
MQTRPIRLLSVVYTSTASSPFSDAELAALLTVSRRNNARSGLTGMLLYRAGRFLQVLEGPEEAVRRLMDRIGSDSGHHSVRVLLDEQVASRQFPEWTMGFPTVAAAQEDRVPGYRSTFDDLGDEHDDVNATTPALRELIRWFQANGAPTG